MQVSIAFDGELLQRGFWLYVWKITHDKVKYFYVGRTGDNSSANASSPFRRMGMHFDLKDNATANCIVRHLKNKTIDPLSCFYDLLAYGPMFPEQKNMEQHLMYRDMTAALESELARNIKALGHEVIGKHPTGKPFDKSMFSKIWSSFRSELT